jgi:hypothetical protein
MRHLQKHSKTQSFLQGTGSVLVFASPFNPVVIYKENEDSGLSVYWNRVGSYFYSAMGKAESEVLSEDRAKL